MNKHALDFYPSEFQRLLSLAVPPVQVRAIKGWLQIGRECTPPELPPLDEPYRLAQWWARRMKQRVPDWIKAIERQHFGGNPVVQMPTETVAPSSLGIMGVLDRCRAVEAAAGDRYASLLRMAAQAKTFDEQQRYSSEAEQARRSWDESVERLQKMELATPKILAAYGKMWNADDVMASFETVHLALKGSIESIVKDNPVLMERVHKAFAALRNNKFTASVEVAA